MKETLDYSGVSFPVSVKDIDKIENQNNFSINLFGYTEDYIYLIRISKAKYKDHMELLLIGEEKIMLDKEENEKQHYVYIKDFNRLIFSYSEHKTKKTFLYALFAMFLFRE